MILSDAITKTYLLAEGKATAPAASSNKYSKIVGLLNVVQEMWQDEPNVEWDSLYDLFSITGTITATDTFALPTTLREISHRKNDMVRIIKTDGGTVYVPLVRADQLTEYAYNGVQACAKIGGNLQFAIPFSASSPEFSGTIKVPGYSYVTELSSASDVLQVDKPLFACYMAAAEYCRTSTSLSYRTDDLVARANQIMQDMKLAQSGNTTTPIMTPNIFGRSW